MYKRFIQSAMRKNRKLGKMFNIIVDMGDDKYMYSVTAERFGELLAAKDQGAFMNWKGRTDYSYSFGVVVQMSDGLWYKAGKVKNRNARLSKYAKGVEFSLFGLTYPLSEKKFKGSAPVPGEPSIEIVAKIHGVETRVEVSTEWLYTVMRSFARYQPVDGEPGIMRLPSETDVLQKQKMEGEGMRVDHIFKYGDYDKV